MTDEEKRAERERLQALITEYEADPAMVTRPAGGGKFVTRPTKGHHLALADFRRRLAELDQAAPPAELEE